MINSNGINALFQNIHKFSIGGNLTDIFIKDRKVKTDCGDDGFKFGKVKSSTWLSTSGGITMVDLCNDDSDHLTSKLETVWYEESPHMDDGRPIMRPDSRPINTQTFFTMCGDSPSGIGDGKELRCGKELVKVEKVKDGAKVR